MEFSKASDSLFFSTVFNGCFSHLDELILTAIHCQEKNDFIDKLKHVEYLAAGGVRHKKVKKKHLIESSAVPW